MVFSWMGFLRLCIPQEMVSRQEYLTDTNNTSTTDRAEVESLREVIQALQEEKRVLEHRVEEANTQTQEVLDMHKFADSSNMIHHHCYRLKPLSIIYARQWMMLKRELKILNKEPTLEYKK